MEVPQLIKAFSNETNLQILSILRSGSFNPRELARILQKNETDISRRLKALERLGLVEGRWIRVGGRNVRIYSLKVGEIKITFKPGSVVIQTLKEKSYEIPLPESRAPAVENLFGREEEIRAITSPEKRVVIVYGIAGIGKTSIAAAVFKNAFWYQMGEMDSFESFMWQMGLFLNTLGYRLLLEYLRGGDREEKAIYEIALEGIESTGAEVVIDDLHKCSDDKILHFLSFLAGRIQKGKIIILSREKPNLGFGEHILYLPLGGLKIEDAYKMVKMENTSIDLQKFAEIYNLTKGHPLALKLFTEAYRNNREISRSNIFDFLFSEVYGMLTEDEKFMLQLISLFNEPLEYEAIRRLYKRKNVFAVLYSLLNKGVLERRGELYFLHDLLRGFVEEVRDISEKKYYREYIGYLLEKGTAESFLRAFGYAVRIGDREKIKELITLRVKKFKRIIQDFPETYMKVLVQIGDNPYAKKELGHIYFQKGLFRKALKLWLEVKDEINGIHRADVVSSLADVYMELYEFEKAEACLKEYEEILKSNDDPEVKLWYYIELTKFKFYMENPEEALQSAFKELEIVKNLETYPELESLVLLHIGDIYVSMERVHDATRYYLQALEISKAYSLSFMEHTVYFELAKAHFHLGEYEKAVEYSRKSVDYFLKVRNYRRAAGSLGYHCVSCIGLMRLKEAEESAEEMIKIAQSTDYPLGWAGYIFLGAIKNLRGEDGSEYFRLGKEKLKDQKWLYDAVWEELGRVYNGGKR